MSEIEEIADQNSQDVLVIKNLGQGGRDIDKAKFKGKQKFRKLHLYWSSLDDDEDITLHDDYIMVLEGLQPQPNLKVLGIHGFSGSKLPKSSLSYYLPNLVELHIENCERCVQLPALGMLPCLMVLNISGMKSVKRIGTEFYYQQETGSRISSFRSLTKLILTDMPILEEWLAPPSPFCYNFFPSLKSLIVRGCSGLKFIPLSSCSSLESLKLQNITDVAANSILDSKGGQGLNSLTSVSIQDSPHLRFFPVEVIQNDTRIQSLEIVDCSEFQGFRILNNTYDKTKLSLGTVFNNSSVSSLRSLKIIDCPALTSLPDLRKWTSLAELRIENCDKLKKSFPYDLASLHSLQTLYVDRFIDVSNKLGVDANGSTTYRIQSVMNLITYSIVLGIVGGLLIFCWNARGATRPYHWDSIACTLLAMWAIYFFGKHGYEFVRLLLEVLKLVDTYRKSIHPKETRKSWDLQEKEKAAHTQVLAPEQDNEVKGESLGLTKHLDTNLKGPALPPNDAAKREFAEELLSHTSGVIGSIKGDTDEPEGPNLLIPVEVPSYFSPTPVSRLDATAVKIQKAYKGYRTRRNLADCAVAVEELPGKAIDFAALNRSSVAFFEKEKPVDTHVLALEQDNEVKWESLDLTKYLDTNFRRPACLPNDPAKREFAQELLSYITEATSGVIGSIKGDTDTVAAPFDYLEAALSKFSDGPFFLGEVSLVDLAYAPFIKRYQPLLLDVKEYDITKGRPKLASWIEMIFSHVEADPYLQAVDEIQRNLDSCTTVDPSSNDRMKLKTASSPAYSLASSPASSLVSSPASPSSLENSVSEAEKLILRKNDDAKMIFCHGDHREEAHQYLQAVDEIQRSLESCTIASSSSGDRNKLKVSIEIAMARLEDEFKNLLNTHSKFIETDWLINLNSSINSRNSISSRKGVGEEFTDDPHDYSEEFELQSSLSFDSGSHSWTGSRSSTSYRSTSSICEIDLIPAIVIYDLRRIAERMISAGYARECLQVYTGIRKLAIESNFHHLKVENLSIGEVQRLKWDVVEDKIKRWIRAANICVRILFASEKKLCEQIFEAFEGEDCDADEACFYETVKGFAVQVLNFADAVSIGDRTPHKLFKILDLHDSLSKLIPDIEEVFDSKLSEGILVHASEILARLADAARGMLIEFENLVVREPSQIPVPGGTIHPLTRYVMNYISLISDYKETLVELIVSKPVIGLVDPIASEMELQDIENKSPLAVHLVWIILNLHQNLDVKSHYYKDPSLPPLFLMNNIKYIVSKLKKGSLELQEMIGDSYLKKLSGIVTQSALAYQRSTLGRLLDCLRDEGLHVTGSFSSGVSKTLLSERLKSFNALFGDVHQSQVTWSVPDLQLREELRIALSETLIPAYQSFLGRFRGQIENGRHPELYIKYSVEDIENAVLEFFESHQNSLQSKRRNLTA